MEKRKKIAILETGGTIAGTGHPGKSAEYKAGSLPISQIIETIPQVEELADLEVISIAEIDSNDITMDHYQKIRDLAAECENRSDIDGIVITHGTDTLEESAFFLNLILDVQKPVVMTGAMRPATAASADGPVNLYQAIALAASDSAAGLGVLALFSSTIYAGRDLVKTSSVKTDAFKLSEFGTLGYMRDENAYFLHAPALPHTWRSRFKNLDLSHPKKTAIYYVHQECDPDLLEYMLKNYDGIVLAATGSGNYPAAIQNVIENYEGNCMIVRSSRLSDGMVFDSKIFDPKRKTIPAIRLSPHKARLLLQAGLMNGDDFEQMRINFKTY